MNAEQKVRHTIGDLVIQLSVAMAKIEELEKQIAELKMQETENGNRIST